MPNEVVSGKSLLAELVTIVPSFFHTEVTVTGLSTELLSKTLQFTLMKLPAYTDPTGGPNIDSSGGGTAMGETL